MAHMEKHKMRKANRVALRKQQKENLIHDQAIPAVFNTGNEGYSNQVAKEFVLGRKHGGRKHLGVRKGLVGQGTADGGVVHSRNKRPTLISVVHKTHIGNSQNLGQILN